MQKGLEKLLSGALIAGTVVSAPLAKATDSPPVPVRNIQLPATYPNMAIGSSSGIFGIAANLTNVVVDLGNGYTFINMSLNQVYDTKINAVRPVGDSGTRWSNLNLMQIKDNLLIERTPNTAAEVKRYILPLTNNAVTSTFTYNGHDVLALIDKSGLLNFYDLATSNIVASSAALVDQSNTNLFNGADLFVQDGIITILATAGTKIRVGSTTTNNLSNVRASSSYFQVKGGTTYSAFADIVAFKSAAPSQNSNPPLPNYGIDLFFLTYNNAGGGVVFKHKMDGRDLLPIQLISKYDPANKEIKISHGDNFTNAVLQVANYAAPTSWSTVTNVPAISNGQRTYTMSTTNGGYMFRARDP